MRCGARPGAGRRPRDWDVMPGEGQGEASLPGAAAADSPRPQGPRCLGESTPRGAGVRWPRLARGQVPPCVTMKPLSADPHGRSLPARKLFVQVLAHVLLRGRLDPGIPPGTRPRGDRLRPGCGKSLVCSGGREALGFAVPSAFSVHGRSKLLPLAHSQALARDSTERSRGCYFTSDGRDKFLLAEHALACDSNLSN